MALKIRRGTNAERLTITPAAGELIFTTDTKSLYIGDGSTVGGKFLSSGSSIINDINLNGHDIVGTGNIDISGNIHASGTITADGDITLGNASTDNVVFQADINSDIIPNTNNTYDLGTTSKRWQNLWANTVNATNVVSNLQGNVHGDLNGSVFADDSTLIVDGTSGKIYGTFYGNLTGDVSGNLTGSSNGTHTGPVIGNVTGNVSGNLTGLLKSTGGQTVMTTGTDGTDAAFGGQTRGDHYGSVFPNNSGLGGAPLIDGNDVSINLRNTIVDDVIPKVDGVTNLGSIAYQKFKRVYLSDRINLGVEKDIGVVRQYGLDIKIDENSNHIVVKNGVWNALPITTTLSGNIPAGSRTTFTVDDPTNILPGAVFSLPGVSERTVLSVVGNVITATETFAISAGHGLNGDEVTFYNPGQPTLTVSSVVPTTSVGYPGSVPGMVTLDNTYFYICSGFYDGSTSIWSRISIQSSTF
jgi:hypothetical protein